MKFTGQKRRHGFRILSAALAGTLLVASTAAAAEGDWRTTYDLVMRWVNFLILAAVIVKFARRPLKDFLSGRSQEISIQIQRLEDEKKHQQQRLAEAQESLAQSAARFEELKGKIAQQGERAREQVLEQARLESRMLMDSARRKIDHRMRKAQEALRNEIIDAAFERALERLPHEIKEEDNQKLLQQYLAGASVTEPS